ncbi:MAG: PD40 domain-containing protein [Candidatus Delongbacteria bacterium]|nr:PD40 domain-containing protein [Candidatus Delongbacteria bacterium]MBN2837098.1 PD40 domain-containing protein [Candidatus Delongbacteria bacterium]
MLKHFLITLFYLSILYSEDYKFLRYPAPSPDGKELAFNYDGDIWISNIDGTNARRLTVHEAFDKYPVWSPDGSRIAFTSYRFGNGDIFSISIEGGDLIRHTYHSSFDKVWSWSGDNIIFTSKRDKPYQKMDRVYQVDARKNSTPTLIFNDFGESAQLSKDGNSVFLMRGTYQWYRKYYRGSAVTDIWRYDIKDKNFSRLTDHNGYDLYPMVGNNKIFYVTDMDSSMAFNIWSMNFDGSEKTKLTNFVDDGVRNPSISENGKLIAFEAGMKVYTYDIESNVVTPLFIDIKMDYKDNFVYKSSGSNISELDVYKDESMAVFSCDGQLFISEFFDDGERGLLKPIVDDHFRNESPKFFDKNTIVFVSDRSGNKEIYSLKGDGENLLVSFNYKIEKLTDNDFDDHSPEFSPDKKYLAYIRGNGDLIVRDFTTGKERTISESWSYPYFSWSFDSKWIAFLKNDPNHNSDIFITEIEKGLNPINISLHPSDDYSPVWSPNGKELTFISRRFGGSEDLWRFYLTNDTFEKDPLEKMREKSVPSSEIVLDKNKMYKRFERVCEQVGRESNPFYSSDGDDLFYLLKIDKSWDLYKVDKNGKNSKKIISMGQYPESLQLSFDGKKIYWTEGNKICSSDLKGGNIKKTNIKIEKEISQVLVNEQKFNELWKIIDEKFYDGNFHGIDWKLMYSKYKDYALNSRNHDEFNCVVRLMLGELNASHLGIGEPYNFRLPRYLTAETGVRVQIDNRSKKFVVVDVVEGSPASKKDIKLGEKIVSVNGKKLDILKNYYSYFDNLAGDYIEIEVESIDGQNRFIRIKTLDFNQLYNLYYDEWQEKNRSIVDSLSSDRLGYIHIKEMDEDAVNDFETELYTAAYGKDALIIDVRLNGGGHTADYLLGMLNWQKHALTVPRGGEKGYPEDRLPQFFYDKPIVLLCDQWSFSNAEIFSHAIKVLKRGKIVGMPTAGGVISTSSRKLLDGSSFRVPFRGWYTADTGLNEENNGCVPDYIIENNPGELDQGYDGQLEKAIEVLLKDLR